MAFIGLLSGGCARGASGCVPGGFVPNVLISNKEIIFRAVPPCHGCDILVNNELFLFHSLFLFQGSLYCKYGHADKALKRVRQK